MPRVIRPLAFAAILAGAAVFTMGAVKPPRPGTPTIVWNGVTWDVKTSASAVGPGPNIFDKNNVWIDASGSLHLRIAKNTANQWTCAEILGPSYGYGTYTFNVASRVDALDQNVVLGLFTWSDRPQYAHREIDIEFARWGNPADPTNGQYVVQPYDRPAHLKRITQPPTSPSTHRFSWRQNQVSWESYDASGALTDSYVYTGSDVPRSGGERVHLNFWLFNGAAPVNGATAEVVLSSFVFVP